MQSKFPVICTRNEGSRSRFESRIVHLHILGLGNPFMNSSSDPQNDDNIRRFEKAVRELIEEGLSLEDHQAWLEAIAARASVDLQEVLPPRH